MATTTTTKSWSPMWNSLDLSCLLCAVCKSVFTDCIDVSTLDGLLKWNSAFPNSKTVVFYSFIHVLIVMLRINSYNSTRRERQRTSSSEVTTLQFEHRSKTPEAVSPSKSPSKQVSTMSLNVAATRDVTPLEMTVAKEGTQGEYEISGLDAQRKRRQERQERLNRINSRKPVE